jgi:hypothetical protein
MNFSFPGKIERRNRALGKKQNAEKFLIPPWSALIGNKIQTGAFPQSANRMLAFAQALVVYFTAIFTVTDNFSLGVMASCVSGLSSSLEPKANVRLVDGS